MTMTKGRPVPQVGGKGNERGQRTCSVTGQSRRMARQRVRIALGCTGRPKPEGFIVWGTIREGERGMGTG